MALSYRRLASRCQTVNEINRLHIRLEDRLCLQEIKQMEEELAGEHSGSLWLQTRGSIRRAGRFLKLPRTLYRLLLRKFENRVEQQGDRLEARLHLRPGSTFSQESFLWFDRIEDWARRSGKNDVEPFSRRRLMPGIMAYDGPGQSRDKTLLICMTGRSFRMMVPISILLQHLPAASFDVLVFRDPLKNGYRTGIRGLGSNLEELIGGIDRLIPHDRYQRVVTLGVSAGGLPALLVCMTLQFSKGIAISGNSPDDPRWQGYGGGLHRTLANLIEQPGYDPNLLVMYGADHVADRESARRLAELLPAQLLEVRSDAAGLDIGHNVLYPILAQSRLGDFLERVVDSTLQGFGNSAAGGKASAYLV